MKITIGNTEFEITDTYSDEDIENINCELLIATVIMTIMATVWRIFIV